MELAGLGAFALAAVFSAWRFGLDDLSIWWPVPMILVLFCLRELDIHNSFFEPGILQTAIFSSVAPMWQKAVSAGAMLAVLGVVLRFLLLALPSFWYGLNRRTGWAWSIAVGLLMAVGGVILDGAPRKAAALGLYLNPFYGSVFVAIEEILEMGFAVSLVFAIGTWRPEIRSTAQNPSRTKDDLFTTVQISDHVR
ncbi:hypothetical protein [Loktanella sp. M215]|uniref:hypothetical protein n=1 Tax=Loktanella sp. M215 TaxID=2675431 RepID=UPI001F429FEA|nr:hypothetical protein [Loktanella sp. M215]MCF7701815.1 hypothetical protein [Loktanella sp. M215]